MGLPYMKYIGYYDTNPDRRISSPAAVDKMNYIADVVSRIAGSAEIISCSTYSPIADKAHIESITDRITVRYMRTRRKHKTKAGILYDVLYDRLGLLFFLIKNINKNDTIIVYHSLLNMKVIQLLRRIKKARIVLEVEEVYNDVGGLKRDTRKEEISYIQSGDAYIFPTEIMNKELNKGNKKSVIVHGTYKTNDFCTSRFSDGKIHIVYAGTFEQKKGGALIAIDSAQYLSADYVLHILGFGNELEIKSVTDRIEEIKDKCECQLLYEGKKMGKEYTEFISRCDIGLSSQNPEGDYNNTSFPSKILSYMCNGLKVVSVRIPVVETSNINGGIWYYDSSNPKKLADAIMEASKDKIDPRKMIRELDKRFEGDIQEVLEL